MLGARSTWCDPFDSPGASLNHNTKVAEFAADGVLFGQMFRTYRCLGCRNHEELRSIGWAIVSRMVAVPNILDISLG